MHQMCNSHGITWKVQQRRGNEISVFNIPYVIQKLNIFITAFLQLLLMISTFQHTFSVDREDISCFLTNRNETYNKLLVPMNPGVTT
jgi:hypothetical protein